MADLAVGTAVLTGSTKTLVAADSIVQISVQATSATGIVVTGTASCATFGASAAITLTNGLGITVQASPGNTLVGLIIDTSGGGSCNVIYLKS